MSAERTAQSTGRWYPVVVEFTEHRVIMVQARNQDAAVRHVKATDCIEEYWKDADELEVYSGVEVSDGYMAQILMPREHEAPIGPCEACPECGAVASDFGAGVYEHSLAQADHLPTCASFIHRVARNCANTTNDRTPIGFFLHCSCEAPGLEGTWQREPLASGGHYRTVEHFPGRTVYPKTPEGDAAIAQAAREHVAGLPHSMNVTLGVMDDLWHADLRRRGLVTA